MGCDSEHRKGLGLTHIVYSDPHIESQRSKNAPSAAEKSTVPVSNSFYFSSLIENVKTSCSMATLPSGGPIYIYQCAQR